ncbi:MAG: ABC transporter ATP-binding protein [Weissella hellenica]|uniref:ABC transporter ATP-binding protein n=1 Tax=Weissella hellenica TaxID=46256 RepID=UPI00388664D3
MKETILKVKNLAVSYTTYRGKVKSVRGLSFKLKKGEALALVGESGCGKSASVKPIMGEHEANQVIESGEIIFTYDGPQGEETVDLLKIDDQKMQQEIKGKQIAMIFQDPMTSLDPTMKIGKQIAEAIKTSSHDLSSAELTDKVRELIDMVGIGHIDTVMNQYPHQLSGGMRQRIVIAIALSSDPSLLICDEPTTALDVTIQARILNLIKKLQRERGLSVIFITHNLGVVANVADRVNVMYAGKIIETGSSEDIFFDPRHPYTWGLLSAVPDVHDNEEKLPTINGTIPDLTKEIVGDAFAPRNPYALEIDFKEEPPMFSVNEHHEAATWLLDERAPKIDMPELLQQRIMRMRGEVYD